MDIPPGLRRWAIRNARVPTCLLAAPLERQGSEDDLCDVDIVVSGTRIESITGPGTRSDPTAPPFLDAGGRMILPCFVDAHTHLDKGHIAPRAPNPDGGFASALRTVAQDRGAHWTAEDVRARMEFGLRSAFAHGTASIRTHIDSLGPQTRISWPVFAALKDEWRDRIALQGSPLFGIEHALDDNHMRDVLEMVAAFGGTLGAVAYPVPQLEAGLRRLFRLASDKGYDLDFHVDETGDPAVNALAVIADVALEFGFEGRILAGHCCSLSLADPAGRQRTIDLVARAGIAVVSLPMCNMYLQSRNGTPRWRGTTAFKELAAAGVPILVASDNTRDPFYAYGDLDGAEVLREATRILHLDHPLAEWVKTVTKTPAEVIGHAGGGTLAAEQTADFLLFEARSWSEWLSRPHGDRIVVRAGRPIAAAVPAYRDLDHLQGLSP